MAKALKKSTTKTPEATSRRRPMQRDRLSCRIDPKIKQRAEDAALLLGQDLTAFTESALNEKAQAVIETFTDQLLEVRYGNRRIIIV